MRRSHRIFLIRPMKIANLFRSKYSDRSWTTKFCLIFAASVFPWRVISVCLVLSLMFSFIMNNKFPCRLSLYGSSIVCDRCLPRALPDVDIDHWWRIFHQFSRQDSMHDLRSGSVSLLSTMSMSKIANDWWSILIARIHPCKTWTHSVSCFMLSCLAGSDLCKTYDQCRVWCHFALLKSDHRKICHKCCFQIFTHFCAKALRMGVHVLCWCVTVALYGWDRQ